MTSHDENERIYFMCAELFKTLANPTRLMILDLLRSGEKTVNEIAELIGKSQANISQHLAVLKQRGIITARREGVNTYYRIACERAVKLCELVRDVLHDVLKEEEKLVRRLEEA